MLALLLTVCTSYQNVDSITLKSRLDQLATQSRTAWVATSNANHLSTPYRSAQEMFTRSEQRGLGRFNNQAFIVYNSSWLSPNTIELEKHDDAQFILQLLSVLRSIQNPNLSSFAGRQRLTLDSATIGAQRWTKLASDWPAFSAQNRTQASQSNESKMTLDVQPRLMIYDSAGKLVEELNLGQNPKAQRTLLPLLQEMAPRPASRFPAELAASFDNLLLRIPAGESTRKLADLIVDLQPHCSQPLTVDARIADLLIITKSEGQPMEFREVARVLPELLDLYWRPVGNRFHLSITAEDPLRNPSLQGGVSYHAKMIDVLREFQRFGLVDPAIGPEQIVGANFDLLRASPTAINAIVKTYGELDRDTNNLSRVLQDARSKGGYTIKMTYMVSTTYSAPGLELGRFFDAG